MNKLRLCCCCFPMVAMGAVTSTAALATPTPAGTVAGPCTVGSVKINTIEISPLDGQGVVYGQNPIGATGCQGVYYGNDYGGSFNGANISKMGNNIGELNDGLLNGEGGLLSPTWFQASGGPQSPMLDIDGDGSATDPGWIRLGKIGNSGSFSAESLTVGSQSLNIADVLQVSMTCGVSGCTSGTWILETSATIIEQVEYLLGRKTTFDHLALVIKSSDRFAVYDFDFNLLSGDLTAFNYTTPYSFTGSWDTNDFRNKNGQMQNISHLSIWARDPQGTSDVPEPVSISLVGLGLAALSLRRRV